MQQYFNFDYRTQFTTLTTATLITATAASLTMAPADTYLTVDATKTSSLY